MKLKTRHIVLNLIKKAGYTIEESHVFRRWPDTLCIQLNISKSKVRGFWHAHEILRACPINELIQVGLEWSTKSINKKYPPSTMLGLDEALQGKSGNFLFGCVSTTYDVGPVIKRSIYHVDYGK